jgi:hypothetical protein
MRNNKLILNELKKVNESFAEFDTYSSDLLDMAELKNIAYSFRPLSFRQEGDLLISERFEYSVPWSEHGHELYVLGRSSKLYDYAGDLTNDPQYAYADIYITEEQQHDEETFAVLVIDLNPSDNYNVEMDIQSIQHMVYYFNAIKKANGLNLISQVHSEKINKDDEMELGEDE